MGLGLFGRDDDEVITHSLPASQTTTHHALRDLTEEDWRRAQGALGIALDPGGNGKAVEWSNPETQTSGQFTPVAVAYASKEGVCRAFLADLKQRENIKTLQGTACKDDDGRWHLQDVQPWGKTP